MGLARLGRLGRRSSDASAPTGSGRWCATACAARAWTCAGCATTPMRRRARWRATAARCRRAEVVYLRRGSAASRLAPADVEAAGEAIAGARWLHLTGITPALSPSCRAAVRSALQFARAGGVRVSLDVNLRRRLWSDAGGGAGARRPRRALRPLIAGEDEAVLLCGSAEASALAERFGVEAVVKLGARGAVGWRNGEVAPTTRASPSRRSTSSAPAMPSRPAISTRCSTAPAWPSRCAARTPAAPSPSPPSATRPACPRAASSSGCWRAAPTSLR